MLKDKLFSIQEINRDGDQIYAVLSLNKEHIIFKGHFPDAPVLPGVAMMQMVKELLEVVEERALFIEKAGNMKFLRMVNPVNTPILNMEISILERLNKTIRIKAQILDQQTVCFKMTALLV
ncbi:MAG: 3-hydroxyacyl-ACP dehydratase [Bacteroidales bacterium]|nr:3-hydroxyacyl-ACP dehydratase [Bacteroidales bacterium]